jgi:hypothetical protein
VVAALIRRLALGIAVASTAAMLGAPIADATDRPPTVSSSDSGDSSGCDDEVTADSLNAAFDAGVDGMVGADYQRAFELDDGRVLWVFQDAFVDDGSGDPTLVHNAAVIQQGSCFDTLTSGPPDRPASWVAAADTQSFRHWYWPLDGYQRDADTFVLFLAEMREEGGRYLANATPVATWTVEIDLATMTVGGLTGAPNPNEELYGFEVTTDGDYVYLYAQCHRQFGFSDVGHDGCAAEVYIARQPLDRTNQPLEYWTGDGWSRNSRLRANIAPTTGPDGEARTANPMQIERDGDRWIAVTKAGDWWGDTAYFDVAPSPEGPWTTTAVLPVTTQGDPDDVASYFISFVPSDDDGRTIAVSNNRWDGSLSDIYHPEFDTVDDAAWTERHARRLTSNVWLPFGDRISAGSRSDSVLGSDSSRDRG